MNNDLIAGKKCNKYLMMTINSLLAVVGLQGTMALSVSENVRYSNSMFSVFAFIMLLFFYSKTYDKYINSCKRDKLIAYIMSSLLSLCLHFGARMEAVENVNLVDASLWLCIIAMVIGFGPIVLWLLDIIAVIPALVKEKDGHRKEINFYQVWIIIFLLWLPTFFALFPGAFVYDAQDEYIEVISRAFTTHHPLLHVLALGGIIHAAEYVGLSSNTGIAVYVLIQMVIMSGILAYSIKKLYGWGIKKKYLLFTILFYGIFPIFPLYSVCTAKDSLFTVFLLMTVLLLIDYVKDGGEGFFNMPNMVVFVVFSVLMMLFRNNGMYAYLVSIPFIWILGRSNKNVNTGEAGTNKGISSVNKLVILMLLSLFIYAGSNYVLKTVTNATDEEHQEMLTVPIQQLARAYTYSKDTFNDEELNTLYEILPEEYLTTYRLRISDVCKSGFNNINYAKNPRKYRKLWFDIGLRKPLVYLNAWLGTSYGYWYPDALNNVYSGNEMYSFQYGESSYFGFETEPPGKRESKLVILESFYKKMSLELFQQRVAVISMLFAPGFVFWVFVFMFAALYRSIGLNMIDSDKGVKIKGNYSCFIPVIILLLLWLTLLLGPTTLVRYVLILWVMLPIYPVLINEK